MEKLVVAKESSDENEVSTVQPEGFNLEEVETELLPDFALLLQCEYA